MQILTPLQTKILNLFAGLNEKDNFYLTGGTVLSACFLKHRKSYDLEFYTNNEEIIIPFIKKLEISLTEEQLKVQRLRGMRAASGFYVESEEEALIVSFSEDSPSRFEQPTETSEIPGIRVDSFIDIATNKILALFERAELEDYIDLYFLAKERFSKKELLEKTAIKEPAFDLYWFGIALARIDDFPDDPPDLQLLIKQCSITEIKDFFRSWRKEIIKEIKTGIAAK